MALTAEVKAELAVLPVAKFCCRKAEAATMIRFAGGIHLTGNGNFLIEAEFDAGAAARRLRMTITEVFGLTSELITVKSSGLRRGTRYLVRLVKDGPALARLTGLADAQGRPVSGLPAAIVGGSLCDAAAIWRGAFLARGSLTEPGRSTGLEVTAPSQEAAMALVGAARRLGVAAKARAVRSVERVVIRESDAIGAMLTRMGATDARLVWEDLRLRREVSASAHRLVNFDNANLRRSAHAAVTASARVAQAFDILGDDVPDHLRTAGTLRLEHQDASLEELGALHDPPLTKDAIAGRIRRLLALADRRADQLGVANTTAVAAVADLED
ncbi:MAG: DNA-binding protein WhiA [Propionibacteriaceae bacterium]|jgi:DNA-binding protein WhiA|nr:DNA-binding protein WhiA [Propionibacteriaceae bacterium]